PRQRLPVHGSVPLDRCDRRGPGPVVPSRLAPSECRDHTGSRHHRDDGPRPSALSLLRVGRIHRGLVRPVRFGRATGVPGLRTDGRLQTRRALPRNLRTANRESDDRDDSRHGFRRHRLDQGGSAMTLLRTRPGERTTAGTLSAPRVASGIVLGIWATFFWFLLISGRENLYLSTRTQWVVPIGAVLLTAAAAG